MSLYVNTAKGLGEWKKDFSHSTECGRLAMLRELVGQFPPYGARVDEADKMAFEAYEYGMTFSDGWNDELKKRHEEVLTSCILGNAVMAHDAQSVEELDAWLYHNTNLLCSAYETKMDYVGIIPREKMRGITGRASAAIHRARKLDNRYAYEILFDEEWASNVLSESFAQENFWMVLGHEVAHRVQHKVYEEEFSSSRAKAWLDIEMSAVKTSFQQSGSEWVYERSLREEDSSFAEEIAHQLALRKGRSAGEAELDFLSSFGNIDSLASCVDLLI